ncbi:MAG: FMN-binding protein [Myxococcota bacterium]|nr:FMN-binding protein [Myxococcota bacterium]
MRMNVPRDSTPSLILAGLLLLLGGGACGAAKIIGGPVQIGKLKDGVYQGSDRNGPNKAVVEVTIENQKIVEVKIIQHNAWKGKKADPIIPKRIIDHQSTHVDAVSGATNSSNVIMNATQKAIDQAYQDQ